MFVGLPKSMHERIELRADVRGLFTRQNRGLATRSGLFTRGIRSLAEGNRVFTRILRGLAGGDGALPRGQNPLAQRLRLLRRQRSIPLRLRIRCTLAASRAFTAPPSVSFAV